MDELARPPATPPTGDAGGPVEPAAARRATVLLLAGYLAFGQYWGVWVILVFDFQRFHDPTESRLGGLYTMLSLTAVAVMLMLAPRLQRLPLSTTVPVSLLVLAAGSLVIAYQPTRLVVLGFVLVGAGNGLIDVYLNAAQRVEVATRRPVLQWLHASYALGGVTGAAIAGGLLVADVDFRWGLPDRGPRARGRAGWNARRRPPSAPRERADGLLHLGAVPNAGAVGARPRGAVRLPRRGLDGHVVGAVPARPARRLGRGCGLRVHRVLRAIFLGRLFAGRCCSVSARGPRSSSPVWAPSPAACSRSPTTSPWWGSPT